MAASDGVAFALTLLKRSLALYFRSFFKICAITYPVALPLFAIYLAICVWYFRLQLDFSIASSCFVYLLLMPLSLYVKCAVMKLFSHMQSDGGKSFFKFLFGIEARKYFRFLLSYLLISLLAGSFIWIADAIEKFIWQAPLALLICKYSAAAYLSARFCLLLPVVMFEDHGIWQCVRRSWTLAAGMVIVIAPAVLAAIAIFYAVWLILDVYVFPYAFQLIWNWQYCIAGGWYPDFMETIQFSKYPLGAVYLLLAHPFFLLMQSIAYSAYAMLEERRRSEEAAAIQENEQQPLA